MLRVTLILILGMQFVILSCAQTPVSIVTGRSSGSLEVTHTALSLKDVPKELIQHLAYSNYSYVRFYRTDLRNTTDRPIRIIWFDAYSKFEGQWIASNVRNRVLRNRDFIDWHSRDDMTSDGWLRPGGTASCHVNWHATETPEDIQTKWAYIGVDAQGNDYFAEAIVPEIRAEKMESMPPAIPPDEQNINNLPS